MRSRDRFLCYTSLLITLESQTFAEGEKQMSKEVFDLEKLPAEESLRPLRPGYPSAGMYPETRSDGYGYGYPVDDGKINFQQIWRTIRKRRLLILIIVIIVTSMATPE